MAVYNTNGCSITYGGTALPGIIDATVTLTMETVDVTEIGDLDRTHTAGIRSGSISGNIFYDQGNAVQAALEAAAKSGTPATFVFTLHTAASYSVSAIVTSFSPSIAVNDVVRASFSATFVGEVTIG